MVMGKQEGSLGPEDWAEAALRALPELGLRGLGVEPLARRIGVTKGSFYWHYRNRAELLSAMWELWERVGTDQVIAELASLDEPGARLERLMVLALRATDEVAVERAILGATAHDAQVAEVYGRVSRRRLAFVVEQFEALGASHPVDAATSFYAEYVGVVQLAELHGDWLDEGAVARRARRAIEASRE